MTPFKSYQLLIKTRSLALEGALIHQNETRLKRKIARAKASSHPDRDKTIDRLRADRASLNHHRRYHVRGYARSAFLAYGFLKGRSYAEMEAKRYSDPRWDAIEAMILKHGARAGNAQALKQSFEQWKQEAPALLKR